MKSFFKEFEKILEYRVMPIPFLILTTLGIWYPEYWPTYKKNIHKIYRIFIQMCGIVLCCQLVIFIILSAGSINFNLDNAFVVSAMINGAYKASKLLSSKKDILYFIKYFYDDEWQIPRDSREAEIMNNMNSKTRYLFKKFFINYFFFY